MNEMKGNHIKRGKLFQKSLTESVKFNYSAKMKNETPIKVYLRNLRKCAVSVIGGNVQSAMWWWPM